MSKDNDFTLLAKFLQNMEPEVSGREGNLSEEQRILIEQFAAGRLTAAERERLIPLLAENESAIALLAQLA